MRFLVLAAISVVIFEARGEGLAFAVAAAAVATLAMRRLPRREPLRVRPLGVLAFIPFFMRESVRGGVDVAVRAFRGPRALHPAFVDYPLRIRNAGARVVFLNSVSLMPGTFTARLDGDSLHVHTLDARAPVAQRLRAVEDRIIAMFADAATPDGGP